MSSQIDINSLFETTNHKTLKRLETYDKILQQCHCRIKYYSKFEKTTCFFAIPEFIIGVPLYNIDDLKNYIINSLKKNGFKIMYMEPNWLFISWEVNKSSSSQHLKQERKKKEKSDYKLVDEYKPSGGLIYNSHDMQSMKDKAANLL